MHENRDYALAVLCIHNNYIYSFSPYIIIYDWVNTLSYIANYFFLKYSLDFWCFLLDIRCVLLSFYQSNGGSITFLTIRHPRKRYVI